MRTEFLLKVKHPNGKVDRSTYMGRKWGEEAANKAKIVYEPQGCEVHLIKVQYQGTSILKMEDIL